MQVSRGRFWIGVLVAAALFLWLFGGAMFPFVVGMGLAYLLDPLADRLQRLGMSRILAACVILLLFVLLVVLALWILVPVLAQQVAGFLDNMPRYFARLHDLGNAYVRPLFQRFGVEQALNDAQTSVGQIFSQGASWAGGLLKSVWSGSQSVLGVVGLVVIAPVVAFYMLIDWDRMVAAIDSWVPVGQRETVRTLARDIDRAIAGFVRGQSLVCLFLGVFYAVGLSIVGLNFGALIGLGTGFLTFIPYVGSTLGLVVSMTVAIVQFWPEWTWIVAVLAIFVAGQFIEGNIISPVLVGDAVGLHPVWLMFALVAFGSLFGFIGVLIAVPAGAAIGVLARFALRKYLASPYYHDEDRAQPPRMVSPPRGEG
ncbi:AI-2E family transporter [Camelimonas lactis]|uniref:Putative PurR-regulated permease PerM n=1 Tax=Camelimonas lactis TaxID=659006 RepID=A0A4R2GZB7_9HYPH|nr:AI-2E family transporter [Camelimonas lactis]TCO15282.1 putative PurR-regulated permease PerM [Camelimonas lactis]